MGEREREHKQLQMRASNQPGMQEKRQAIEKSRHTKQS